MSDVIKIIAGEPWAMDFSQTTRKLIDPNVATDAIDVNCRPAIILFKHKYIRKSRDYPPGYGDTMCFV